MIGRINMSEDMKVLEYVRISEWWMDNGRTYLWVPISYFRGKIKSDAEMVEEFVSNCKNTVNVPEGDYSIIENASVYAGVGQYKVDLKKFSSQFDELLETCKKTGGGSEYMAITIALLLKFVVRNMQLYDKREIRCSSEPDRDFATRISIIFSKIKSPELFCSVRDYLHRILSDDDLKVVNVIFTEGCIISGYEREIYGIATGHRLVFAKDDRNLSPFDGVIFPLIRHATEIKLPIVAQETKPPKKKKKRKIAKQNTKENQSKSPEADYIPLDPPKHSTKKKRTKKVTKKTKAQLEEENRQRKIDTVHLANERLIPKIVKGSPNQLSPEPTTSPAEEIAPPPPQPAPSQEPKSKLSTFVKKLEDKRTKRKKQKRKDGR
jgi:hypothetical protein